MRNRHVFSVILAGGASSRLFPFNKILSDLTGTGQTLIQQAAKRAQTLCSRKAMYVLSVKELVLPIRHQLKLSKDKIFIDPVRRGTWPALLWAMAHLRRKRTDAVLAVLTGDQLIPNLPLFRRAAHQACRLAAENSSIVMLGVTPGSEALTWTGYGVFKVVGHHVTAFQEKPSVAQAQQMIQEGGWQWNSGMFFFRISTAEKALKQYQPSMYAIYEKICQALTQRKPLKAKRLYAEFPLKISHPSDTLREVDNSIDFAIMMHLVHGADLASLAVTGGLPVWTDLGQWDSLADLVRPDHRQNICVGEVRTDPSTERCILAADRGFRLEVRRLSETVVALSGQGLLVLPRRDLGHIKELVAKASAKKFRMVNLLPHVQVKRSGRRVVVSGAPVIR